MGKRIAESRGKILWLLRVAFCLYLLGLCYVMFLSERYGRAGGIGTYSYNLHPFQEINRYFAHRSSLSPEAFFINMYGNILAFVPFGFLVPLLSRRENRHFLQVFGWCLALTLLIEVVQLIWQVGCFDVDDMILNMAGGILGYLGYLFAHTVWERITGKGGSHETKYDHSAKK